MQTDSADVDLVGDEVVVNLARAGLFAALTGAFAYVSFPNPLSAAGLPVTLQVLGVFLAGIFLGPLWGGFSMVLYILTGAAGTPVFEGGGAGIGVLVGPTGGYIWAFPVAAALIGLVVHGGLRLRAPGETSLLALLVGLGLGVGVIYAAGVAGLMIVLGLGPAAAFTAGAAPFVPAELFKIAAAIGLVRSDAVVAR